MDIVRHKRKLSIHSTNINNIFRKPSDAKFPSTPHFNLKLLHHIDDHDEECEEEEEESHTSLDQTDSQSQSSISIHRPAHVLTRRQTLDPNGNHTLRNYVSHRKDTIVQRVIGYNYDDHSTAGGLYIRVGIGSN